MVRKSLLNDVPCFSDNWYEFLSFYNCITRSDIFLRIVQFFNQDPSQIDQKQNYLKQFEIYLFFSKLEIERWNE